jgi:hypothetical protein
MPQYLKTERDELSHTQREVLQRSSPRQRQKPAFIAINDAADYLGIARSTLYKDFLPSLETIRIGKRNLIVMESLDRLVAKLRGLDEE